MTSLGSYIDLVGAELVERIPSEVPGRRSLAVLAFSGRPSFRIWSLVPSWKKSKRIIPTCRFPFIKQLI
jgi:hypothetical protein